MNTIIRLNDNNPHQTISNNLTTFGSQWCAILIKKLKNPFWIDVFTSWETICKLNVPKSPTDVLNSPIWFNPNLSRNPTFLPHWYKKRIVFVKDMLNSNNEVLTKENLGEMYTLNENNFINYYNIKLQVKQFLRQSPIDPYETLNPLPNFPFQTKILFKNKKGCRDFYQILNFNNIEPIMKEKWHRDLETVMDMKIWKQIFKTCFKVFDNTRLMWFQCRILYRILGTKLYLFKLKMDICNRCRLCQLEPESIIHIFTACPKSKAIWLKIKNWINTELGIHLDFSTSTIILGYLNSDSNYVPINLIILVTKYYIFYCASKNIAINFESLKIRLQKVYTEEKMISQINLKIDHFDKIWSRWESVFTNSQ